MNATAYAAKLAEASSRGNTLVAVINKDANQHLRVALPARPGAVELIVAESLTATEVHTRQGVGEEVPPHSMALFTLRLKS